jgi:putative lipoprotein
MTHRLNALAGCFAALTLIACASTPAQPEPTPSPSPQPEVQNPMPASDTQVTGTVRYRERIALSPEAVVVVEVVEVTPEGAQGKVIGEQTLKNPGQVPITFTVPVPADRIRADGAYTVRARITDGTRTFNTGEPVPVLTQGAASNNVEIIVRSGG